MHDVMLQSKVTKAVSAAEKTGLPENAEVGQGWGGGGGVFPGYEQNPKKQSLF